MAKDIPEYQRGTSIRPAAAASGFDRAGKALGQGPEMIGKVGLGIAKNAALEQATLDGIKAGQTPGRTLLPAFTDTDKAFVEAYKKEEFQTVSRTAESFLNKTYFDIAKNPSPEGLSIFQKTANEQINKLSGLVSEDNRNHFRRSLESEVEQKFYSLSKAVETKVKHDQKNDFKLNQDNNVRKFTESVVMGFDENAEREYIEGNDYILSQVGTDAVPTQAYATALIQERNQEYQAAKLQAQLHKAQEEKKDPEFWAERAKLPPTPENIQINAALMKQQHAYDNMMGMQSQIALTEAIDNAKAGTLTESMRLDYQEKMDAVDFAKFNHQLAKINLEGAEKSQKIAYINKNSKNDVLMATMSGKDLDAAFNQNVNDFAQLQGREPTLDEMANIATEIAAPIPSFNKQLSAMIDSANPENAVKGSDVYNRLFSLHPRSVDDIDEKTGAKADLIRDQVSKNIDPIEAVKYANESIDGLRPQDLEDRDKSFKEQVQIMKLNSPTVLHKNVDKWMDIKKYDTVSDGVYTDFMNNFSKAYRISGDWKVAKERAINETNRVYGEQTINGYREYAWLPINKDTPLADNETFLRNTIIKKSEVLFKDQQHDNQFGYSYQLDHTELKDSNNIVYETMQKHKGPIRIERMDSDGKKVKGQLMVKADRITDLPTAGQTPSRGLYFLPDGNSVPTPIYDPKKIGEVARFALTEEDLNSANLLRNERDEAAFLKFKQNEIIRQEMDRNLTEQVRGTIYE